MNEAVDFFEKTTLPGNVTVCVDKPKIFWVQ